LSAGEQVAVVDGLRVELLNGAPIVEDVSFALRSGEILGLVGESGSGKTTTALALLGYARRGARIAGGSLRVAGQELTGRPDAALRGLRGRLVAYVPQDPSTSLSPAMRIGDQVAEMLHIHFPERDADAVVTPALERVHLPGDRRFRRRYPHQLSGGQQQRLTLAVALVGEPPLVVLDEPTTGLDVVTQARILDEIRRLREEIGVAMVYVTHNLAVVSQIADRVAVMYAGRVVEEGPTELVLREPRHPYTRGLVASIPDHATPRRLAGMAGVAVGVGERPPGCAFAPRCPQRVERCSDEQPPAEDAGPGRRVRCFEWARTPPLALEPPLDARGTVTVVPLLAVESLRAVHRGRDGTVVAADDVSFEVPAGSCVALVGESGSGKTTIARCIAGLHEPEAGRILLDGVELAARARDRTRDSRRRIQIVFQNPGDSLNPRCTVGDEIGRPARVLRGLRGAELDSETIRLLERVRLPARLARRYPRELSGGERQRVAIARALAATPDMLVCDEITSALDVSVQAAVLELLAELRVDLGLALLFISHDLGVVASIADRVLVLERGVVREQGLVGDLLARPTDEYTRALVAAAPRLPA
jgi:peptide/nickel transport system ATP-binding protein